MQFEKSSLGWIAGAAALVGGAVYLVSRNDIRLRMTPNNSVALDREIARVTSDQAAAGAGITAAVVLAGLGLWQWQKRSGSSSTSIREIEETTTVNVPVRVAYDQWTQFEDFPRFMPSIEEVRQIDDTHLRWRAIVAGRVIEWNSQIIEQIPDQRIEWRSTDGPRNGGVVTFDKLGEDRTRVCLRMWYEPRSADEKIGDTLGVVKLATKGNLLRFKQLLQQRGQPTGAWRGEVGATH